MPDTTPPTPTQTRTGKGRFTESLSTAQRDARAAELRAQGLKLQDIADELGYHDKSHARQGINRALDSIRRGPAEALVEREAASLDALYEEALEVLQRDHITVSHGKIITDGAGNPILDDGPKLAAIDRLVKVRESYRRLFGLDRPVKVDATVHQVTQQDLELQEMLQEAQARTALEEQQIRDGSPDA
ncbi:hypothetical protein ACWERY_16210 [Streptomyces sp. NPDC004082]